MTSVLKRLIGFAAAGLILAGLYWVMKPKSPAETGTQNAANSGGSGGGNGGGRRGGGGGENFPTPVLVETVRSADLPIVLDGVGTARPLNTVTVKPQVEGRLATIRFSEGQQVKKGDIIATIDDTTFRALRDQAVAKRQLTETQLANAKRDLERFAKVGPGVIAQKTIDTQTTQVAQLEAQLKSDVAAVASAEAVLGYTEVRAPIDGRTGLRLVDEGNIVRSSDQAGLVVITQIQPITVQFTLPQQQLADVSAAMARGKVMVDAMSSGDTKVLDRGTLTVFDNQIDQTTGTVKMKAEFPNAALQLWPGQFVNVRLEVDKLRGVLVVPTPAVQRGPTGAFVFVLTSKEQVAQRPVTVQVQTPDQTVIASGLTAGQTIVTSGFGRLQDGGRVIITGRSGTPPGAGPGAGSDAGKGDGKDGGATGKMGPAAVDKSSEAAPAAKGDRKRGDGEGRRRRQPDAAEGTAAKAGQVETGTTQ